MMQWKALLLATIGVLIGPARAAALDAPPPKPVLTAPADDPQGAHCFTPDPETGVKFDWTIGEPGEPATGYPVASYLDIRRRDRGSKDWRRWIATYAKPPFTMLVRPSDYDSDFAWHVWAVDRSGAAHPYATSSGWRRFCTLPMPEPPPYGSSVPRR